MDIENIQATTLFNEIKFKGADCIEQKTVWEKIKILRRQLHNNDISKLFSRILSKFSGKYSSVTK